MSISHHSISHSLKVRLSCQCWAVSAFDKFPAVSQLIRTEIRLKNIENRRFWPNSHHMWSLICLTFSSLDLITHSHHFTTSRNRRITLHTSITNIKQSREWYFVSFPETPNYEELRSHGIVIEPQSFIFSRLFSLFLSPVELQFLIDHYKVRISEVKGKIINNSILIENADNLILEVSTFFDSSVHHYPWFHLEQLSRTTYLVNSNDLHRSAIYFASVSDVYSVIPNKRWQLHNRLAAGYSQLNTKELNQFGNFQRYLQDQGLTGDGTVVTIADTPLDLTSSFFYDPYYPEAGRYHSA